MQKVKIVSFDALTLNEYYSGPQLGCALDHLTQNHLEHGRNVCIGTKAHYYPLLNFKDKNSGEDPQKYF